MVKTRSMTRSEAENNINTVERDTHGHKLRTFTREIQSHLNKFLENKEVWTSFQKASFVAKFFDWLMEKKYLLRHIPYLCVHLIRRIDQLEDSFKKIRGYSLSIYRKEFENLKQAYLDDVYTAPNDWECTACKKSTNKDQCVYVSFECSHLVHSKCMKATLSVASKFCPYCC